MSISSNESSISHTGWGDTRQALILGLKPIVWQDFCRKLYENERIRADRPPPLLWIRQ